MSLEAGLLVINFAWKPVLAGTVASVGVGGSVMGGAVISMAYLVQSTVGSLFSMALGMGFSAPTADPFYKKYGNAIVIGSFLISAFVVSVLGAYLVSTAFGLASFRQVAVICAGTFVVFGIEIFNHGRSGR